MDRVKQRKIKAAAIVCFWVGLERERDLVSTRSDGWTEIPPR
jgi:hypothetical protein